MEGLGGVLSGVWKVGCDEGGGMARGAAGGRCEGRRALLMVFRVEREVGKGMGIVV